MSWFEAAARWYLILAGITWAFAPAVRWLCPSLAERGVTFTRPIAMLAALYPAWLLASLGLTSFTSTAVTLAIVFAAILGWGLVIRRRAVDRLWLRSLVLVELVSALMFAAYVWLRGYTPQILGTEKPMDVAFLASSTRAFSMPPPDPWFAGEPINYYYLGYLLHGTVGRLARVSPETGFNLALATVFSMTAVAAFGVAWNAVRPWLGVRLAALSGCFALFAVAISGNLYAPWRLIQNAEGTVSAWWWDSVQGIGWRASRIVCDGPRIDNLCPSPATETINEFPFFSFLLGDLHPHVMALPYTLVAIGLAWNLALRSQEPAGAEDRRWLVRVAICGAIVGSLYALNAWDFPTYLFLVAVGVWIGAGTSPARAWRPIVLVGVAAILAWLPFLLTYVPPTAGGASALPGIFARLPIIGTVASTFGPHLGERTSLVEYLTVFGAPYAFGVALVTSAVVARWDSSRRGFSRTLVASFAVTIVPGVMLSVPVIPLCGIPLALAIEQLRGQKALTARWFALLLFSFAWALSIGVEIVYVRDVFEDRMNTLFKFYYQTWTLYGIAAAVTIAVLWSETARSSWRRAAVVSATVAALVSGAAYPTIASYQWTEGFREWRGLDGIAYGEELNPDDTAAIRWLGHNATLGDVVLEAAGCSYLPFDRLPFNRVSAFTGVPAVIGWGNNHQRQWRTGQPSLTADIDQRAADVAEMYADPESPLFDEYGVTWLFIGEYETGDWQAECATAGPYDIARFAEDGSSTWREAYRSGDTRIYRRLGQ